MAFGKLLIVLLVLHVMTSINYFVLGLGTWELSEEDEFEIEQQLKALDKPSIKTIKTNTGQIVDCVDIYKQTALDDPLLKNHKIQLKPSSYPKSLSSGSSPSSSSDTQPWMKKINIKGYKCPNGTVPIRRTSREDLRRSKYFFKHSMPSSIVGSDGRLVESVGQHVALRQVHNLTKQVPTAILTFGIKADVKIDKPYILMNQLSASVLWLESGPPETSSAVQAGWVVAPMLFPDTDVHLFAFWRDGPTKGGFNTDSGGFVQVDSSVGVGVTLPSSEYGAEIMKAATFFIHQDMVSGNWWLSLTGTKAYDIGYWPIEKVPNLRNGATYFAWGGLVRFLENASVPQMGNGHFPDGDDASKVSAMWKLHYVDQSNVLQEPRDISLFKTNVDNRHCCDLIYRDHWRPEVGYSFFFGGPGGDC